VTGYIRQDVDELAEAIGRVGELDPAACRRHVKERFDVPVMVSGYEQVYRRMAASPPG
jgi:hypothetical protein